MLAWIRRIIVSLGIGGASYLIMLAFMILSVVYDKELEPVITFAFETGRRVVDVLDSWVAGNYWGQVAVNHLRERVNMTHVILSIPAIIIAVIFIGIPLNRVLGGTKSALQRMAIALISIPATVVLAVALFTFNALVPETYASLLRFADWIWQGSLEALNNSGDTIPGARKLANLARQGFSGHHYVIMALCSSLAAFVVNAFFLFGKHSKEHSPRTRIEVAESYKAVLPSNEDLIPPSPSTHRSMRVFLLTGSLLLGYSAATSTRAFANWWIVRSSDETCLVVDIEPTDNEKGITKIGKESYPTAEEAEADVKRLCKIEAKLKRNP
jgi:hypothetical protein